jgi:hypothetical protein
MTLAGRRLSELQWARQYIDAGCVTCDGVYEALVATSNFALRLLKSVLIEC